MSRCWLLLALGLLTGVALAQRVPDPTEPPVQTTGAAAARGLPRLHSTLIGPGRREAVIDGRLLHVGERVGAAVLEHIEPGRVVLRGPDGEVELTLSFITPSHGASR